MSSKRRRQTFDKLKRELAVKEKRVLKQQKKEAARIASSMEAAAQPQVPGDAT